jgi:hypothetical protein
MKNSTPTYVVSCLTDAICYLSQQEFPCAEHLKNTETECRGKCLQCLHRSAQQEEKFRVHLETPTVFINTSHDIQKDLTNSISAVVTNKIKEELKQTSIVSIISIRCRCVWKMLAFAYSLCDY